MESPRQCHVVVVMLPSPDPLTEAAPRLSGQGTLPRDSGQLPALSHGMSRGAFPSCGISCTHDFPLPATDMSGRLARIMPSRRSGHGPTRHSGFVDVVGESWHGTGIP